MHLTPPRSLVKDDTSVTVRRTDRDAFIRATNPSHVIFSLRIPSR